MTAMATDLGPTKVKCNLVGSHLLDPDGDVILVFSSRYSIVSGPLEVDLVNAEDWNAIGETQYKGSPVNEESTVDEQSDHGDSHHDASNHEQSDHEEPNHEDSDDEELSHEDSDHGASDHEESNDLETAERPVYELGVNDIKIRVSSQLLSLTSPIFKAMFSRNFSEGHSLHENGYVEIPMPEDSAHGILIILRLLHVQYDISDITPSLMMQIAWAADKYDIAERIQFWSRRWFEEVKCHVPGQWMLEVITWLGMFRMLKFEEEESQMENLARGHISDTISCGQLPIYGLIDYHKHNTITTLQDIFRKLDNLISSCWTLEEQICANGYSGCSSMILGCLLRGLKGIQLYPIPEAPTCGMTLLGLAAELRNIRISTCGNNQWTSKHSGRGFNFSYDDDPYPYGREDCTFPALKDIAEELELAAAKSYKDSIMSDSKG